MKHGKKPTRKQKALLQAARLNCENWLVVKDTAEETVIQNRQTGRLRTIQKGRSDDGKAVKNDKGR